MVVGRHSFKKKRKCTVSEVHFLSKPFWNHGSYSVTMWFRGIHITTFPERYSFQTATEDEQNLHNGKNQTTDQLPNRK